jgi:hypothetical protein
MPKIREPHLILSETWGRSPHPVSATAFQLWTSLPLKGFQKDTPTMLKRGGTATGKRFRYDWQTWADGGWWILRPGEDFPSEMSVDDMYDRAYVYAYRHQMYAHIERHSGGESCCNPRCRKTNHTHPEEQGPFLYIRFRARSSAHHDKTSGAQRA